MNKTTNLKWYYEQDNQQSRRTSGTNKIHRFIHMESWHGEYPFFEICTGSDPQPIEDWIEAYGDSDCEIVNCTCQEHSRFSTTRIRNEFWCTNDGLWIEHGPRENTRLSHVLSFEKAKYSKVASVSHEKAAMRKIEKIIRQAFQSKTIVTMHSYEDKYPVLHLECYGGELYASLCYPPGDAYHSHWRKNETFVDAHIDGDSIDWASEYKRLGIRWDEENDEWAIRAPALAKRFGISSIEEADDFICRRAKRKYINLMINLWVAEAETLLEKSRKAA